MLLLQELLVKIELDSTNIFFENLLITFCLNWINHVKPRFLYILFFYFSVIQK